MRRFLTLGLITLLLLPELAAANPPGTQVLQDAEVEALLEQMSPGARVGQLFIVTFPGADVSTGSDIGRLIAQYQVGGVILLRENDNIGNDPNTAERIHQLATTLQQFSETSRQPSPNTPEPPDLGPYIPLFIGIQHEGSANTHSQLLSGVSPLPSNMAIGATWKPEYAEAAGVISGLELSAMGINLLLGPPADVVEEPQPSTSGDLGTRVFGGEPFWVAQMTSAYVRGVHTGSNNRVAVVPLHFPGQGSADRSPDDQIPTVRRPLDRLIQVDLQPYFSVTGNADDSASQADGLMTGHIRYSGLTGPNPRLLTNPISLDPQVLQQHILTLPEIAPWREAGGLLISDSLGLGGIQAFYDPQEKSFNNRLIAQYAFLAGNDMLYLGNFGGDTPAEHMQAITDTITYFAEYYNEDQTFQARVDAAVRRILRAKLDIYGSDLSLANVLPSSQGLAAVGQQTQMAAAVAQDALTLLSPDALNAQLAPDDGDRIVIFTDTRAVEQCSTCGTPQPLVARDALQHSILVRYGSGPGGADVVSMADIQSFSFDDLARYLGRGPAVPAGSDSTATPDPVGIALNAADWVVFVMLDVRTEVPASRVIKDFLASPPVSSDTEIVALAMGAPYYLDATEVSNLTAYYALYGYSPAFIDVAARALFQGATPTGGASPVSIRALDYNIVKATEPNPNQKITLTFRHVSASPVSGNLGTPTPTPQVRLGDSLALTTGIIMDRNNHPVPDGTPVDFILAYPEVGFRTIVPEETVGGVAQAEIELVDLPLEPPFVMVISASSIEALSSESIRLIIPETGDVVVERVTQSDILPSPTPIATATQQAAPTTPAQTPTLIATEAPRSNRSVDFADLYFALFGLLGMSLTIFIYGLNGRDANYGLILALPTIVFGLLGYNYYALVLPGSELWRSMVEKPWAAALSTWIGGFIGLALTAFLLGRWGRWISVPLRGRQFRWEERRQNRNKEQY